MLQQQGSADPGGDAAARGGHPDERELRGSGERGQAEYARLSGGEPGGDGGGTERDPGGTDRQPYPQPVPHRWGESWKSPM